MSTRPGPKKRATSGAARTLYLCCFHFDEPGERPRSGTFQIVVEADDPLQAVDRSRTLLRRARRAKDLFDAPTTIYIEGLVELRGSFTEGLIVNWESGDTPPSPLASICALIPPQPGKNTAEAYDFDPDPSVRAEPDGSRVTPPFIDFGGAAAQAALSRAQSAKDVRPRPAVSAGNAMPHAGRAPQGSRPRRTPAQSAAARARREALASTLAEIRATSPKSPKR